MNITILPITKENESALSLPNDPFPNEGRVIPLYDGRSWSYRIDLFPAKDITMDCFPDEHYSFDGLGSEYHGLAAYVDGECVGFALFREEWNKWLLLDNILIPAKYRRMGIGTVLIDAGMKLAADLGKIGVWAVCQDNNLQAYRFYMSTGFQLDGVDFAVYEGTKQEGKADLYLYKRIG